MSLPYYSREPSRSHNDSIGLRLFQRDLEKLIGHIPRLPLAKMASPYIESLLSTYYQVHHKHLFEVENTLVLWRNIIESYMEVINIVIPLGKSDNLCDLYTRAMEKIRTGQQDLFHSNEQIKAVEKSNPEARFKALMEKYHVLHEANLKATFSIPSYCLDEIMGHSDRNRQMEKYASDEMSYKLKKLESSSGLSLKRPPETLKEGIDPHLRNAISHRKYEFISEHEIEFEDRDWKKNYKLGEFWSLTERAEINFLAQACSLLLFAFDNSQAIESYQRSHPWKIGKKELLESIDRLLRNLEFIPSDISVTDSDIICKARKSPGFDGPSEEYGNLGDGRRYHRSRPPLQLDTQAYKFLAKTCELPLTQKFLELLVHDYKENLIGQFRIDALGWHRIVAGNEAPENVPKYILIKKIV